MESGRESAVNSEPRARWMRFGVGLVVLALFGGCSSTASDQDLRPVRPAVRVTTVTIQTVSKRILVPVVLNGNQTATFLLDTGANITVMTSTLANRLGAERPVDGPKVRLRMASGQDVEMSVIRLKSIGVGSARLENFVVALYDLPTLPASPPITVDGLLGNDFVGQFTMTVDPRAGTLTLQLYDSPAK